MHRPIYFADCLCSLYRDRVVHDDEDTDGSKGGWDASIAEVETCVPQPVVSLCISQLALWELIIPRFPVFAALASVLKL